MQQPSPRLPDQFFGVVDPEFYELIGRIVLATTMVEDRVLGIVWALATRDEPQPTYAAKPTAFHLELIRKRLQWVTPELQNEIVELLQRVDDVRDRRNALAHSLWPNPSTDHAQGWRSRPLPKGIPGGSEISWTVTSLAAMEGDLSDLCGVADDLLACINRVPASRLTQAEATFNAV